MMTSSRLVRSTKGRLFACLGVLTLFAGVIFLYHSTRVELDEVRNSLSKCRQEQDSLAAQVQVISEYKKNLEKSLNQEKAEHRQTKEKLQTQMNDEQQLRDKENLENVNKYKALQQQYKLLQSEHEDLNDICSKARSEQSVCAAALSHVESQLTTLRQEQEAKDAQVKSLKLKQSRQEEENKILQQKLNTLQVTLEQAHNNNGDVSKMSNALGKGSSTKHSAVDQTAHAADSGLGFHELPLNVLPVVQRSSTAAQEEILGPARPAQPGLLQSVASKMSGKQSTTPQINPDALQSQDKTLHRALPIQSAPLLLPNHHQEVAVEKQDVINNGFQGVLPVPHGFGNDHQYAQQNAIPLQAPYRLQRLSRQEIPQNQGQSPPLAPVAAEQTNVLPAPPNHVHEFLQHLPNFNAGVHQNLNPFRNDMNLMNRNYVGYQDSKAYHPEPALHKLAHDQDMFHLNGLKAHDAVRNFYDVRKSADVFNINKNHAGQENGKHVILAHGKQFERPVIAAPFHKSGIKNVNIVPLDGDVNQHAGFEIPGVNSMAEMGHHVQESIHAKKTVHLDGQHEVHQAGHYNYQGGDYDKEDPPANNEAEDEDLDQIDYNNEPNQARPAHPLHPNHSPPKMIHRRFADQHHHDGIMVNPR